MMPDKMGLGTIGPLSSPAKKQKVVCRPMEHVVHYLVLSAGQVSLTFGRGTAVGRLLNSY